MKNLSPTAQFKNAGIPKDLWRTAYIYWIQALKDPNAHCPDCLKQYYQQND